MSRPFRWGLSLPCYQKFAGFFSSNFPVKIPISSQSQASLIRDAITFAEENNLPGQELKGRVRISLESPTLAVLDWKNPELRVEVEDAAKSISRPISVFDVIGMCEEDRTGELVGRYTILEGVDALDDIREQYNLNYHTKNTNEVEFLKEDVEDEV